MRVQEFTSEMQELGSVRESKNNANFARKKNANTKPPFVVRIKVT
jgi:hypothetical protein